MNPAESLAQFVPGVPALEPMVTLPSGTILYGFATRSDAAVDWWKRLIAVSSQTRLQPIAMYPTEYQWLTDVSGLRAESTEDLLAEALTIDGDALLRNYGWNDMPDDVADGTLAGGRWPENAIRYMIDDLGIGIFVREVYDTTILLVPAAEPWQIPCVLRINGWNGYPSAAPHAAILRHFAETYDARLYNMGHDGASLVLGRPPTDRPAAVKAAWEYQSYCDTAYDVYGSNNLLDIAACLLNADVWHCWWD